MRGRKDGGEEAATLAFQSQLPPGTFWDFNHSGALSGEISVPCSPASASALPAAVLAHVLAWFTG